MKLNNAEFSYKNTFYDMYWKVKVIDNLKEIKCPKLTNSTTYQYKNFKICMEKRNGIRRVDNCHFRYYIDIYENDIRILSEEKTDWNESKELIFSTITERS